MWLFRRPLAPSPEKTPSPERSSFSTHMPTAHVSRDQMLSDILKRNFRRTVALDRQADGTFAMDGISSGAFGNDAFGETISDDQLNWYGSQSFIGYQACALLAQNWLIDRACSVPARDYCRNGWEITENGGTAIDPKIMDFIRKQDKAFKIKKHLVELVHFCRLFGIRHAMPVVNGGPTNDSAFYENPFNIDGVKPGTYQGITQIDPNWISPWISGEAASNPAATDFYEPTWWQINGKKVHKSHLIIAKNSDLPDIMKPTYFYGSVSVTQRIAERVYAAERTANEAPMLALSKRSTVLFTDLSSAMANESAFIQKLSWWSIMRNNFGVKVFGEDDKVEQHDTGLADLSDVIFGQYSIVASAAGMPVTKLMGTPPKGMNATGEYDEANYHEMLESLQEHEGAPLLDRHYQIMIKSDVAPKFPAATNMEVHVEWKELDAMTAEDQAKVNLLKAQTDVELSKTGAIDGQNVRDRIISEKSSGYNGLDREAPIPEPDEDLDDGDAAEEIGSPESEAEPIDDDPPPGE